MISVRKLILNADNPFDRAKTWAGLRLPGRLDRCAGYHVQGSQAS